jgi:hypothetical protein
MHIHARRHVNSRPEHEKWRRIGKEAFHLKPVPLQALKLPGLNVKKACFGLANRWVGQKK